MFISQYMIPMIITFLLYPFIPRTLKCCQDGIELFSNSEILCIVKNINNSQKGAAMEESTPKEQMNIMNSKYVWIVGAIILLVIGWFGLNLIISPFQDYKVALVNAPQEISSGGVATFTWRIDGPPTTINHTSVHIGLAPNPGELGKNVKPQDTKYTEFVQDFASGKYDIPLQFVGNILLSTPGTYYYRVHAQIKDKNYWTEENTLVVKPAENKVTIISPPKEATTGTVTFTWRVDGPPTKIQHTAVYFGTESTPGALGKDVAPTATKYIDFVKDFANGDYNIPLQFVGNAKIATAGAYFFRAYAQIGNEYYWTDEFPLQVNKPGAAAAAPTVAATPTTAAQTP